MTAEAPAKMRTFDLKYNKPNKTFVLNDGEEIEATAIDGRWFIENADGSRGHMTVTCSIEANRDGEIVVWLDPEYERARSIELGIAAPSDANHAELWQQCFNRKQGNWRVWDKDAKGTTTRFVSGYQGPTNVTWRDRGGHLFAMGRMYIDARGIACFVGD